MNHKRNQQEAQLIRAELNKKEKLRLKIKIGGRQLSAEEMDEEGEGKGKEMGQKEREERLKEVRKELEEMKLKSHDGGK